MCMFYFWFYFTFIFVEVLFSFIFCCWGGGGGLQCVHWPFTSLHPLPNIQYRKGALLCFNLLLYSVVNVWRRGVSAHLRARPSLLLQRREAARGRTATALASREPPYCLTGRY